MRTCVGLLRAWGRTLYHPRVDAPDSLIRASCLLCGRPTYDPSKKERPWSRAVSAGTQVLICPICQVEREDWTTHLDRCRRCGSTRLSVMLGEVVCRQCGFESGVEAEPADQP
jgi:ribosomal protein L37E